MIFSFPFLFFFFFCFDDAASAPLFLRFVSFLVVVEGRERKREHRGREPRFLSPAFLFVFCFPAGAREGACFPSVTMATGKKKNVSANEAARRERQREKRETRLTAFTGSSLDSLFLSLSLRPGLSSPPRVSPHEESMVLCLPRPTRGGKKLGAASERASERTKLSFVSLSFSMPSCSSTFECFSISKRFGTFGGSFEAVVAPAATPRACPLISPRRSSLCKSARFGLNAPLQ